MSPFRLPGAWRALPGACVLAALLSACGIAPAEPRASPVRRAVLVSVDGLRADALERMPTLSALRARAQWSDSVMTVVPSLTVPGHLSLLSGRDVTEMGILTNTLDETAAMTLMVNGATSIFQWVRAAGGRSTAIIGGSLVPPSQLAMARSFFGLDVLIAAPEATRGIIDEAIVVATDPDAPQITFVHVSAVDAAGHSAGWVDGHGEPTPAYLAAIADVDGELARLVAALEPAIAAGELAVMITADHGGGRGESCTAGIPATHEHCTAHDGDRRIPYLLMAPGVVPGRLSGQPSITQLAPTLANLLRVSRPPRVDSALWF
jgi:predicted AlkP superfamily pyrophosphatase or phosphodiesterase